MKFSTVIPTYKRKDDLEVCLESISKQTILPSEIIIIDDDFLPEIFLDEIAGDLQKEGVDFVYYQKDHPKERRGLSESKNIAIDILSNEIFFILDDDLILDDYFFENIIKAWEQSDDEGLAGIGGVIKNNRRRGQLERVYSFIFGLLGEEDWDVNDVAFQSWNDWIDERKKGYYIHGGVTSFSRKTLKDLGGFTTFSGGRTTLEDVDFCLRAKQMGYYFLIEPTAKVIHEHSLTARESAYKSGFKEGFNRRAIFIKSCENTLKNYLWFIWANIGWMLKKILTGKFTYAFGMTKGLLTSK